MKVKPDEKVVALEKEKVDLLKRLADLEVENAILKPKK